MLGVFKGGCLGGKQPEGGEFSDAAEISYVLSDGVFFVWRVAAGGIPEEHFVSCLPRKLVFAAGRNELLGLITCSSAHAREPEKWE